jgi:hypothetical protein
MIANEHFRQHPAILIWDRGRVKGLPSKRGRTPYVTGWNLSSHRSRNRQRYCLNSRTEHYGYEVSSPERRGDYCRARDRHTGFSAAFGPGPYRANDYRPRRLSAWRVRPFLSDVQCAGCVSQSLRALGTNMAEDDPIGRYNAPCGLAAVTVVAEQD